MAENNGEAATSTQDDRSLATSIEAQAGVKGIEAISTTWTKWSLIVAYIG